MVQDPQVVLIAPTAFKGTLTPIQAARRIASLLPVPARLLPVADGGDGTLDVLPGRLHRTRVRGGVLARWKSHRGIAVIEMAEAAGLRLIKPTRRSSLESTTFGVGQLIRPHRRVWLGIGGSASTDGGVGALTALGAKFYYRRGELCAIDARALPRIDIDVLTDVRHTLMEAPRVFGPQKGAGPREVRILEERLARFADVAKHCLGIDLTSIVGGGAAGGLGAGLAGFMGARLRPGADFVLDALDFDRALKRASLVVTGEGRVDATSLQGKAVGAVIARARRARVPVAVVCGDSTLSARALGVKFLVRLGR